MTTTVAGRGSRVTEMLPPILLPPDHVVGRAVNLAFNVVYASELPWIPGLSF